MQGGLCPSATSQLVHYISLGDHGPILQHPSLHPPPLGKAMVTGLGDIHSMDDNIDSSNLVKILNLYITWNTLISTCNSEIRELQRSISTYNMRYFLLCTSTVHDQSGDICIPGYLRILWIGNAKSLKIDNIYKRYVLCQNWSISLKIVKLNPWMQQLAVRCQSKNITWNRSMACRDTIGLLSL